jgi:hypothetical protein
MVDDFTHPNEDYEGSKVSMAGKMRNIQYDEAKRKIDEIRKSQSKFLEPNSVKELPKKDPKDPKAPLIVPPPLPKLEKDPSIFLVSMNPDEEMTLSVYNKKDDFFKKRPNTAPMAG